LAGRRHLAELCKKEGIGYRQIGKLIVAVAKEEEAELSRLNRLGRANGVEKLELVGRAGLQKMESAVRGRAALFSPMTAIVDSHGLMRFFRFQAQEKGAVIACNSEIKGIFRTADGYELELAGNDRFSFLSRYVVNAAGHGAAALNQSLGLATPTIHPAKGCYFSYQGHSPVSRLIYPVPPARGQGLGIHATLDLGGRLRFGPDLEYVSQIDDFRVPESLHPKFAAAVARYLPDLDPARLSPEMAGIRPRLQGPKDDFRDFLIREESAAGCPGFITLLGIESPGLTAAPAIAGLVSEMLG
jgi:L-2-hydroxyglutarate oxidase LhgO